MKEGGTLIGVGDSCGIYSYAAPTLTGVQVFGSANKDGTAAAPVTDWDGSNATHKWMSVQA